MRSFDPEILDLLDEGRIKIAGMIRFDFGEGSYGFIQRWSGYTYDGVDYEPLPEGIISISDLSFGTGTTAAGVSVVLAESPDEGLTPEVITQVENYSYRDRPVTIYDMYMHPDTGAVLSNPIPMIRGYINALPHSEDPERGYLLTAECETRALDYSKVNGRIRSTDDQARRCPDGATDLFYQEAGTAGRVNLKWGRT